MKFFSYVSGAFILPGLVLSLRYLYFREVLGEGQGHIQSVILAGVLLTLGFMIFLHGLQADVNASSRRLLEDALFRQRRLEDRLRAASAEREERQLETRR